MTWRGTTTVQDRVFACLPYLLPLMEVTALGFLFAARGIGLFSQFPVFQAILSPLIPLIVLYNTIPFAGLIVFILLLTLVVRNANISHFIRFNTMQAILIDILLILGQIILNMVLLPAFGAGLVLDTVLNIVLLGVLAAVLY